MKAFPALRLLALVGLSSLCFAPQASAQLFDIVANDSFDGVDAWNNTGIAIDARFQFNYGSPGVLRLTLKNLGGTARPAGEGGGTYANGILTQFAFDRPSGLTYVNSSYTQVLAPGSGSEPSSINFALDIGHDIGSWNFDVGAEATSLAKGLSGGFEAVFTFKFSGSASAMANFNEAKFFSNNGSDADMGFKFESMGKKHDSFEKVGYWVNDCPPESPPIPEPSTYGAMAVALLFGVIGFKRHRVACKQRTGTGES